MVARGWTRAARAARQHLSSRLNALTLLPLALRARSRSGVRVLGGHVLGRGPGSRRRVR